MAVNKKVNLARRAGLKVSLLLCTLVLSTLDGVHGFFGEWGPDLEGPWCATRPPGEDCCSERDDDCSVPILETECYCDIFCNQTAFDCCPDYWGHCHGLQVPATTPATTPRPPTLPPPRTTSDTLVDSSNCSSFWLPANGSCYHISDDSLSSYDAEMHLPRCSEVCQVVCLAYGGMLVEIDSQAKQDSIAELLKQKEVRVAWVSGKIRQYVPEFVWLRGNRPVTYTNWSPGHPIIPPTHERCVFLRKKIGYRWRSHTCDRLHRYICEKNRQDT